MISRFGALAPGRIGAVPVQMLTSGIIPKAFSMDRLSFESGSITFNCEAGTSAATPETKWWWVNFTGESVRHAMFQTAKGDTQENVKSRVLQYYEKLLADRARPAITRGKWGRPPGKKE